MPKPTPMGKKQTGRRKKPSKMAKGYAKGGAKMMKAMRGRMMAKGMAKGGAKNSKTMTVAQLRAMAKKKGMKLVKA